MTNTHNIDIHPQVISLMEHYQFDRIPVEGTLFKNTFRSEVKVSDGRPSGTAIIGLYANKPFSASYFHKLKSDEVWHFYGGDPFMLVLLHGDGSTERVMMGSSPDKGEHIQFTVPANTWQAGCLVKGSHYALYGCTMSPGFRGKDFLGGSLDELLELYPHEEEVIKKLCVKGHDTLMPEGYEDD